MRCVARVTFAGFAALRFVGVFPEPRLNALPRRYAGLITSQPMYGRSTSGTTTLPSGCW